MHNLNLDDRYFYKLYSKAYQRMQYWQDQMHQREGGSPEWQIASTYRQHYGELCLWLDDNTPNKLMPNKIEKNN